MNPEMKKTGEENSINQVNDEERAFEQLRNEIRNEQVLALGWWKEMRHRYIYRGREYSAQEVTAWFMNAPLEEVKVVGVELGEDWRAIGRDVKRMAASLNGLEQDWGLFSDVNEPFDVGRDISRLLFDLSILIACIRKSDNKRILDFAGGSGWVAEYLNRDGFDVYTFDVERAMVRCIERRILADHRIDGSRLHASVCDGHNLQIYVDGCFGNIVCFDSLHHMTDFAAVFREMFRVLEPGGRASFAEPGARHADSEETREFIRKYKRDDPDWIERSIVVEEIQEIAYGAGFSRLRIKPFLLPSAVDYSLDEWRNFSRDQEIQERHLSQLISFNHNERVIFYLDKPR